MALAELTAALRRAAAGGTLTLDRATLTAPGTGVTLDAGYDALVRSAFGLGPGEAWKLAITPAQIPDPSGEELRISAGRSSFAGLNLTGAPVDLRLRLPAGSDRLLVTAELGLSRWTFQSSFRAMRGYPFERLTYSAPGFVFAAQPQPSYDARGVGAVMLAAGLNLAMLLKAAGPVAEVRRFVTLARDSFPFAGPLDLAASPRMPALRLRAELDGTLVSIGPLTVDRPFVELRVEYVGAARTRSIVLVLGMRLSVPNGPPLDFTTQLREDQGEAVLALAAPDDRPLTPDQLFQLVGGQSWGAGVPGPLRSALQSVGFKDLEASTTTAFPPQLRTLTTRVGSTAPLQLFDQFRIDEFDVIWFLRKEADGWSNELQFIAWFQFYPELFDGEFEVGISTELQLWGSFSGRVPLAKLLSTVTGGLVTPPSSVSYDLTQFALSLDAPRRSFAFFVAGDGTLDPFGNGLFVLGAVQFTLTSTATTDGRTYGAGLNAALLLAGFPLTVTADYETGGGWNFRAAMPPSASVSIQDFLQQLFPGAQVPDFLAQVRISNVLLAAHTGGRDAGWLQTGAAVQLRDVDLGFLGTYTLDADAQLRHTAGRSPSTEGGFSFATTIPGIGARVTLGYRFTTGRSQLVSVSWGPFRADYDITRSVLTFSVGEATLGGVLGQLVGLVIGDDGYRLPPPWNLLDSLSLRGFEIVFDFSRRPAQVSVRYRLSQPLDLGFLKLTGLELGKAGDRVVVRLDATFLDGSTVPAFDPLQGPPTPPGRAPLDLRLLALGQRVTVSGIERSRTILDAIQLLASFDDTPGDGLPRGPTFSASSPWLVGLHVLFVGETVDIAVVFVDPALYGLRIALAGEKAAIFDGLAFEILYKKVTDTIGVWQIRLALPRSMRMLQFGALAITLPELGLDVYTNGDFRVDFGFPYNSDFSRSFGIQYFPFTGAGGFYFGKLSGETATGLPRPTQPGAFDPVIEFGLGLQLGLGKDISAGILTAGISLTVFGIVEGVIAAWNPAGTRGELVQRTGDEAVTTALAALGGGDVGKSYYYRVAGTIGIIGKIYGSVNFAIVKASVNLTVTISLQAVIEAHQPLLIAFQAKVDVSLSVEIDLWLFSITIHLTFSMTVRESFTLGSRTAAPWGAVGNGEGARARLLDRAATPRLLTGAVRTAPFAAPAPNDERTEVRLSFALQPTVAGDPADSATTRAKLVAMLYMDAPHPDTPPRRDGSEPAATSFERFAETVFVWAAAAFGGSGEGSPTLAEFAAGGFTQAQLATAFARLADSAAERPLSYARDIVPGLFAQLRFSVSALEGSLDSAAPFPMIPQLHLRAGAVDRTFADGLQVDDDYLRLLRAYFERIAARYQDELARRFDGGPPHAQLLRVEDPTTSYSAAIVEDFVLLLARGMLRAGLDAFDDYAEPYGGRSLATIAEALGRLGNSIDAVALGAANARLPLRAGTILTLRDVRHQLAADESFASLLSRFGIADRGLALVTDPANANVRGILRLGATLAAGGVRHEVGELDTLASVAAEPGWSAALLAQALADDATALLPLSLLTLPQIAYPALAGDTLAAVADAFGLAPAAVAADVATLGALFDDPHGDLTLTAPGLTALPVTNVIGLMRAREAAPHLSGASARFLLYGMRPPAPASDRRLGSPTALYDLNGQQFDVPADTSGDAVLSLGGTLPPWIAFLRGGQPAQQSSVSQPLAGIARTASDLAAEARARGVPARVEAIYPLPGFGDRGRRFTLRRTAPLQAAVAPAYPFDDGGRQPPGAPRLWFVPSALAQALTAPFELPAAFALEATSAGVPPQVTAPRRYGWGTLVDVTIKQGTELPDTYEVFGGGAAATAALEALIDPADPVSIASIALLTGADATGQAPAGYVDLGLDDARTYLVKTNLSTETNPGVGVSAAAVREAPPTSGLLNDPHDFLRLLWEASVTRAGGFMLTYRRSDGSSLPQALFAGGDTATLSVLVLHEPASERRQVHRAANVVLVGDGFDPAHVDLAAVAAAQPAKLITSDESLEALDARFRIERSALAEQVARLRLAAGVTLAVDGLSHQVRGPSSSDPATETLDQIASRYGVAAQAIVALNPGVGFSPLLAGTLLRIPPLQAAAATYPTLAAVRDGLGASVARLAADNGATIRFASGQTLAFEDRLTDRVATLPPGNVGFTLTRTAIDDSARDASAALGRLFNMLGFGLAQNVSFGATTDALPVGPTRAGGRARATRAALLAAAAADTGWHYEQTVFVAGSATGGDPADPDPYGGVGGWAQVRFAPRDMFGNVAASAMTQPRLAPPQIANDAPLRVAYRDPLIGPGGWPSVAAGYAFARSGSAPPALTLTFHFDPSSYTPTTPPSPTRDPDRVPVWQQRALADAVTYRQLARQLSAPRVSASVATTLDGATAHALAVRPFAAFASAAAAYLAALAADPASAPAPPVAPTVSLPVAATNAGDLFALRVELTLARAAADVDDDFRGSAAERLVTPIAPQVDANSDRAHALTAFAQALEEAYAAAPVFLKVASGRSQRESADADSIWIVRLRTAPGRAGDPGIAIAIDGDARYYAPRPLANVLLSRGDVPLLPFDPQTGVAWDRPAETAFTSVALDTWGRQALAALDRFLSPDFASATFLLDHVDPGRAGLLAGMLDVKQRLAAAIAGTLQPILTQPPLPRDDRRPLDDAVETMRQQVLSRAENAYVVTAICQYAATVSSPWKDAPGSGVYAPRLYGPLDVTPRGGGTRGADEPAQPWSFTVARPKLAPQASFVTSALTVVDPAAQTSLPLALDFSLSNIEHEIERGIDGDYLASSWLALVIPFSAQQAGAPRIDLSIGDVDVPVVLREVPTPPTLRAQEADPQPADEGDAATRLAHAKAWQYGFTYEKDVIAQDTIDASVLFNLSEEEPNLRLAARELDLFDHLARFVAIWPQLLPVLVEVLVPDRLDLDPASESYRRAHRLVADLLRLLQPLPQAWATWHAQPQERRLLTALASADSSRIDFSIAERRGDADVLQAIRTPGAQTAVIWDPRAGREVPLPPPLLTIADGETVWRAQPVSGVANTFEYADRDGALLTWTRASTTLRQRTPQFAGLGDGLDVAAFENAWSALRVLRNRDLVRAPDGRVIPTTPVFVYQTPEIKFASRVTPRLQRDGEIDVAGLSAPPRQPLATHLQRLADALIGSAAGARLLVRFDAEFGQTLGDGLPAAVVPILLGTPTELDRASAPAFVRTVAGFVVDWFKANGPGDGELRFTLTLFPTLSRSRVPLLQLTGLRLRRADVTDLPPAR
ncbi:LysM domain-containing protein [Conexibacter sp. JD483]|uniref:LysM peptidoglycan-binding domain-containing protein n=1 Tax=unclassified Conexibacter TaxID=2627773 RepID=UPI0027218265|nr:MULTISPECIES: LysM domain-containing protein [unclassified Conexibacter]MDO8185504.1 LysM domain-containing protein [Conexibacter sp. CPCC 205706]MDO8197309.1 LysM domain-containing protein [Conexibacter sp. CPCC 205762]MDR9370191.1 LysM domain-containing protein [Conexibacter sp. JD483]